MLRQQAIANKLPADYYLAMLGGEVDDEPEEFDYLPENQAAIDAFLACTSRWTVVQGGRWIAPPYSELSAAMGMLEIKDTRDAFWGVRVMEQSALEELNRGH